MNAIGNVRTVPMEKSHHVEWKILNFTSLTERNYSSPSFFFADECWNLVMYPNQSFSGNTVGYISLYLKKKSSSPSIQLEYSLGLKTLEGENFLEHYRIRKFKKINATIGVNKCISRSDLLERTDVYSPTKPLTVFCNLKYPETAVNERSHPLYEKKCTDKSVQCSDVVIMQNCCDHVCKAENAKADGFLCEDYKKVLLSGRNHDLILKVGDKELQAHQDILRARSRVFESMLDHDMKEKSSGIIDIPDCKPQAMEQFLSYVYCGKVETLDQSNMLELYYVADKYEMMGLKAECINFIKKSLSQINICNVIQLALNHTDSDLLEHSTDYFINNVLGIMHTVEWQSFMKDNSTVANELLIKAFKKTKL